MIIVQIMIIGDRKPRAGPPGVPTSFLTGAEAPGRGDESTRGIV